MTDKAKFETYVTPTGTLNWCYLQEPRSYKGGPEYYDTELIVEGPGAAQLSSFILEEMQGALQDFPGTNPDKPPMARTTNANGEEIPGSVTFKFRVAASTKTRKGKVWDRKPKIVDAEGNPSTELMENAVRIGPGTKARLAYQVYRRNRQGLAGVTLQPVAVQVIELVPLGGGNDFQFGSFGGGGYVASDASDAEGEGNSSNDELPF